MIDLELFIKIKKIINFTILNNYIVFWFSKKKIPIIK